MRLNRSGLFISEELGQDIRVFRIVNGEEKVNEDLLLTVSLTKQELGVTT